LRLAKYRAADYPTGKKMPPKPIQLDIYHTSIPMRSFEHAAATRSRAEAIVLRLEYDDGFVGWGETLPREYVTGETYETVPKDIEILWQRCLADDLLSPGGKPREVPLCIKRHWCSAAAAALEIASLRRILHNLHAIPPEVLQAVARRPRIRTYIDSKVSGVLGSRNPVKTARRLRAMRWFEMTDFKLKLGLGEDADRQNLEVCFKQLRRGLAKGVCTLRVDVNGGWDADTTPDRVAELEQYGVCAVEQPVYCSAKKLLELAGECKLPLIADESILSMANAKILSKPAANGNKVWWNLRISKNGGLLPTLDLMHMAAQNEIPFTLGCMVGESSILSAAQRRLLQLSPVPRFVEGNYGRLLLTDDLLTGRKSLRFGYGGTLKTLKDDGLGVEVAPEKLQRYGKLVATLKA